MSHPTSRAYKALVRETRARRLPCCLCGQPIDYTLDDNHRLSFTMAHILPVDDFPHLALDPTNIAGGAHRACNSAEGKRPHGLLADQGGTSAAW